MTTISSWDQTRAVSTYHFDNRQTDLPKDVMTYLGRLDPATWNHDVVDIVSSSRPASWGTRGYKGEGIEAPPNELQAEEYDIERVGADPKMTITHLNWKLPVSLQTVSEQFGLQDCMNRIHVQMPGELWNLHIDKLQKWCPDDPSRIMRIMIQLTEWQPGQFWEYGNYHYNQWRAGDVTTFDWANIPHSTANAGHHPRVTLQITGLATEQTHKFLTELAQ
jgi:hypothetical protein